MTASKKIKHITDAPKRGDWKEFQAGLEQFVFGNVQKHNTELEQAVLGACLIESGTFEKVLNIIKTPKVFHLEINETIFTAFMQMSKTSPRIPIDILTTAQFLADNNQLGGIGGAYYLTELTNKIMSIAHTHYHACKLYDMYIERDTVSLLSKGIRQVYNGDYIDPFELRSQLIKDLRCESSNPFFIGGKASDVMKEAINAPKQKYIIGNLFKLGDLAILFAPKKSGKSLFTYQCADNIAAGRSTFDGLLPNECGEQKVLYVDFELTLSDLNERYVNPQSKIDYPFHPNLDIFRINPENFTFDIEVMLAEIEKKIIQDAPDVLIIDNITAMLKSISDGDTALEAMRNLLRLKSMYGLSILALGHTPKRAGNQPLEAKDILGSGNLLNLATSAFAIGNSITEKGIKYIKHLDTRNGEILYDDENVILCSITKEDNFTFLKYEGQGFEKQHLLSKNSGDEDDFYRNVCELNAQGKSWEDCRRESGYEYSRANLQKACKKWAAKTEEYLYDETESRFKKNTPSVKEADNEPYSENYRVMRKKFNTDKKETDREYKELTAVKLEF